LNKTWVLLEKAISPPECFQLLNYVSEKQESYLPLDELPPIHEKIFTLAKDYYDLSSCNYVEQWYNSAHEGVVSGEHIDKDEQLWIRKGEVRTPLCSAILYLSVQGLKGANLEISYKQRPPAGRFDDVEFDPDAEILVPQEGNLIFLNKAVWHRVSSYKSGHRTAFLLNFWDGEPLYG